MKQLSYLSLILLVIVVISCSEKAENEVLTPKIVFEAPVKNNDADLDWWVRNMEGPKRDALINFLFEKKLISSVTIHPYAIDSLCTDFKAGDSLILDEKNFVKYFGGIQFEESWDFNPATLEISKDVKSFAPTIVFSEPGNPYVLPAVFPLKNQKNESVNFVVTPRIQYDVSIINDTSSGEWYRDNVEKSSREKYLTRLFEVVKSGKLDVYDMFGKKIVKQDVALIFSRTDTLAVADLNDPEVYRDTVITSQLRYSDITRLRFLEEWSIDESTLKFKKNILGLCIIQPAYDELGSFKGYIPLFWIYFDKKYPEALYSQQAQ